MKRILTLVLALVLAVSTCGSAFALEVLVVVTLNGSVSSLILIYSVGRYENGGHHCKASVSGSNHVGHNVAVVVLASPDVSAVGTDDSCYSVVDKGVEIFDACGFKLLLVVLLVDLSEDILETVVILLGNGVLGSEPYVLLGIESEVEAASCKALNGLVLVVKSLDNACAVLEIIDKGACFLAVLVGAYLEPCSTCISVFL